MGERKEVGGREADLLPCPFCGREAAVRLGMGEAWVACPYCNSSGPFDNLASGAAAKWNRRTPSESDELAEIFLRLQQRGVIGSTCERCLTASVGAKDEPCRVRTSAGAYLMRSTAMGSIRWTGDRGAGGIWGRVSAEAVAEGMRIYTSFIIDVEPCEVPHA